MRQEIGDGRFVVGALPPDGVSVIVVTHRDADRIEAGLTALRRAVFGVRAELIIVDGGSGDETVEVARSAAPDARIIEREKGEGFAAGCHAGVAEAVGQWLVFVRPGTLPAPGGIRALLDCANAEPQAGIVGARRFAADDAPDPRNWWVRPGLWTAFCFGTLLSSVFAGSRWFDPEASRPWSSEVQQVPVVTGGFMLVSRRAWEDTGGFDRGFVRYGEDADLCLRASAIGYRPTVTGRAVFRYTSPIDIDELVALFAAKARLTRLHVGKGGVRLLRLGVFLRARLRRLAGFRKCSVITGEVYRKLWQRRREW